MYRNNAAEHSAGYSVLVCCDNSNFSDFRFGKAARCALPHIRFHELRHSCASILLNNGCNLKDVQTWMGHSDIRTTANIYGHLDLGRLQQLSDSLSAHLRV